MKNFARLKKYFIRYGRSILAGLVFLLLTNLVGIAAPWVLKNAIDKLSSLTPRGIFNYALLIVGIAAARGLCLFFTRLILIGTSRKIEYHFRNDIFAHLQRLPHPFFVENKTGDIMARVTEDLNAVRMAIGPGFMHFFNTLALFTASAALMFYINPRLALWALAPLPLLSLFIRTVSRRLYRHFRAVQQKLAAISTRVQENFSGIRIIKAYAQEKAQVAAIKELGEDYVRENLRLARFWGLFLPTMMFTAGLGLAIVLWFGGRQVIQGRLSLGEFVAFNGYLAMLLFPMMALGWVINLFQRGSAALDRIGYILDEAPQQDKAAPAANRRKNQKPAGRIDFRNLYFSYDGKNGTKWALENINLSLPAGGTLGIVGPVGSGKTTLVNLLPRLLEASRGEVLVDGTPVRQWPLRELRRLIGYVPQESLLFSASIKENILYGLSGCAAPDCDEEGKILHASRLAELWEEVQSFPRSFDTPLGERGITLSGGQRQRTALARALVMDPLVLILDDTFASVDTFTESKILRHLKSFMAKRTCLIVSHRMATVKDADRIIVLEGGKITQEGRHEDLLNKGGFYARTYRKQLLLEDIRQG